MHRHLLAISWSCLVLAATVAAQSPDRDGDGLSDFQEVHKYRTDPAAVDSDGDGVDDGDWRERREYTYTIRTVIQVMPTYDKDTLNDDYQDCRVLYECDEYIELEVIHYPLNTCAASITPDKAWRRQARSKQADLAPGITTNWDAAMQRDLRRELRSDGIDLDKLTDKEVVERVSRWALERAKSLGKTCVWAVDFADGKPFSPALLAAKLQANKGDRSWTDAQQYEHELFGKGMYENRTRGTCTTTANYLATVLRAVGIPTRCIVTIPLVDGSDPRNVAMIENRLTHHAVRRDILRGVRRLKQSFAAHTYNEVWVGGRWRRLNYSRLGQNILDPTFMGLMTRVHTFRDLADAGLGRGWGLGRKKPSDVFRYSNPYTALTVSDRFGVHAKIDNPEVESGEPRTLTIAKAYWFQDDENRPKGIGADWPGAGDPSVGHILVHIRERGIDFADLHTKVTKAFELRPRKGPALAATSIRAIWPDQSGDGAEFYLRIAAVDFAKMRPGLPYTLVPTNQDRGFRWVVDDIVLTRPAGKPRRGR